jgi:hypothetical protein
VYETKSTLLGFADAEFGKCKQLSRLRFLHAMAGLLVKYFTGYETKRLQEVLVGNAYDTITFDSDIKVYTWCSSIQIDWPNGGWIFQYSIGPARRRLS